MPVLPATPPRTSRAQLLVAFELATHHTATILGTMDRAVAAVAQRRGVAAVRALAGLRQELVRAPSLGGGELPAVKMGALKIERALRQQPGLRARPAVEALVADIQQLATERRASFDAQRPAAATAAEPARMPVPRSGLGRRALGALRGCFQPPQVAGLAVPARPASEPARGTPLTPRGPRPRSWPQRQASAERPATPRAQAASGQPIYTGPTGAITSAAPSAIARVDDGPTGAITSTAAARAAAVAAEAAAANQAGYRAITAQLRSL